MRAYLGLGANLGDRAATLRSAIGSLAELGTIVAVSPAYETAPVGYADQPDFLNAVVIVETKLGPLDLLDATQAIENVHGRTRSFPNAPRTLDIDILFLDEKVMSTPRLTVPHPRVTERAFALVPLADVAPDLRDPRTGRNLHDLAARVAGRQFVRRRADRLIGEAAAGPETPAS